MTSLFEPLSVGDLKLANRIVMAPLTRMRATQPGDVPNDLMVEYYRQRASAGLIVTEGTQISPIAKGYMDTPGIHSDEQVAGWQKVTGAVHAEGGLIAAQLWHVGRVSHESFHGGDLPVSASAVAYENRTTVRGPDGNPARVPCPTPRALTLDEIAVTVDDYRRATENARAAGFDAVEIHGAHGYLLHQFTSATSNRRDDEYGGSVENRARIVLDTVDAVIGAWEPSRAGIRISPFGSFNGLHEVDGEEMALYLGRQFAARGLGFLHLSEPDWAGGPTVDDAFRRRLRGAYDGVIVGAGNYDTAKAERLLDADLVDAVAFGRAFIANPDLPERLRSGARLNPPNPKTFYGGGEVGYTDYPTLVG